VSANWIWLTFWGICLNSLWLHADNKSLLVPSNDSEMIFCGSGRLSCYGVGINECHELKQERRLLSVSKNGIKIISTLKTRGVRFTNDPLKCRIKVIMTSHLVESN